MVISYETTLYMDGLRACVCYIQRHVNRFLSAFISWRASTPPQYPWKGARKTKRFPKVSRGSLIEQGEEARSGPPPRERRFPKTSEEGWREEKEESEGGGGNLQIVPASNVSST